MNTNELRDALSAGAGNIDARADAALAVDQAEENLRRRLSEAEGCLVRLREEANRRRYDKDDEALVKLLDDVGSPLAYLVGFVEATTKRRGRRSS